MITSINQLDFNKKYSYADYLTWQFADRVELIKGWINKMSPAPSRMHQDISGNLFVPIHIFLKNKTCKVYDAPFDVRLLNSKKSTANKAIYTVVQPDICVICDEAKLDERGCIGSPDWIIEIISKGNTKHELETKFNLYQESGVREYWIIGPGDETVTVFDLKKDKYVFRKMYSKDAIITVGIFTDFTINMQDVFTNL